MQLSKERSDTNLILAWEPGRLKIGAEWFSGHVIVTADRVVPDWTTSQPDALGIDQLQAAMAANPEILLLGTGPNALLPNVRLIASLAEMGIGLEFMDTPAACRTFNVLVGEGRRVVAALFNGPGATATD